MAEHEEANGNADTISALEKKIIKQVEVGGAVYISILRRFNSALSLNSA